MKACRRYFVGMTWDINGSSFVECRSSPWEIETEASRVFDLANWMPTEYSIWQHEKYFATYTIFISVYRLIVNVLVIVNAGHGLCLEMNGIIDNPIGPRFDSWRAHHFHINLIVMAFGPRDCGNDFMRDQETGMEPVRGEFWDGSSDVTGECFDGVSIRSTTYIFHGQVHRLCIHRVI